MFSTFHRGLIAASLVLLSQSVLAQPEMSVSGASEGLEFDCEPPAGSMVLYDQTGSAGSTFIISQNFAPPNDALDSQIADDVSLGDTAGWSVTGICALGIEFAPITNVNVWFYNDAGGTPGAAECAYANIPATSDGTGDLTIELPTDCNLIASQSYWLSVQAEGGSEPEWFWRDHRQAGAQALWQNPGDGFGTGCTTWQNRAACTDSNPEFPDQAFVISGVIPGRASFLVSKDFDDDNQAEVEVTLECNTGLPLQQTTTISEGDPVNFVVTDFEPGTMDCEVTEVVPSGYTASYDNGASVSPDSCAYTDVEGGGFACDITNTLQPVDVDVTKVWIDENPEFNANNSAEADWLCNNVSGGGSASGSVNFFGNPDTDSFSVFPDWESGTTCSITEVDVPDRNVEVDDGECQGLLLMPGSGASCTIFNTRLFAGIPTLSQYGLALLALLMLGIGFVAYRRIV